MYCSHCGKEIDEQSNYCSHCGKQIGGNNTESDSNFSLQKIFNIKLSERKKKFLILFGLWAVLHLFFLIIGDGGNSDFWPFTKNRSSYYYSGGYLFFNLRSYDFSEFLFYVFLLPFTIYTLKYFKVFQKIKNLFKKSNNK